MEHCNMSSTVRQWGIIVSTIIKADTHATECDTAVEIMFCH